MERLALLCHFTARRLTRPPRPHPPTRTGAAAPRPTSPSCPSSCTAAHSTPSCAAAATGPCTPSCSGRWRCLSVARGMAYLHSRSPPLIHLDLKSANILLDDRWRIKVRRRRPVAACRAAGARCSVPRRRAQSGALRSLQLPPTAPTALLALQIADFGLARVRQSTLVSGTGGGTPEWMAPEVLRSEGYDEHADVYSYGVSWFCDRRAWRSAGSRRPAARMPGAARARTCAIHRPLSFSRPVPVQVCLWEVLTGQPPWQGLHAMQVRGPRGSMPPAAAAPHLPHPSCLWVAHARLCCWPPGHAGGRRRGLPGQEFAAAH